MTIINNLAIETFELPGIRHQTVAGYRQGVKSLMADQPRNGRHAYHRRR